MTLARGDLVELQVERLASSGEGVARAPDGRVVFVAGAAPGDRVRARIASLRRRHAHAEVAQLLAPGAARVLPFCPVFGECGGCSWQHVAYPAQCEAKRAILRDAFVRVARIEPPEPFELIASPLLRAHRGRARLLVAGGKLGFRRARSHAVCAITHCPVLAAPLNEALARLAQQPALRDGEIELALGDDGAVSVSGCGERGCVVSLAAGEDTLRCSTGVFFQSNVALREELRSRVLAAAGSAERVLELHAGAGFFTLGLARRCARVLAVESSAAALRDLASNALAAALGNIETRHAEAEDLLQARAFSAFAPQLVVLDPPRSGLERGAARELAALGAERVVYVSCDPGTLARDAGLLRDGGYRLAALTGFDQFPHTPHVEALAVFESLSPSA